MAVIGVLPIHQRLAELYVKNKRGRLTPEEMADLQHCLTENVRYCWEMAYLENQSLIASMTEDMVWQHEICCQIDEVQSTGKRKKSGRKRSTDEEK